MHVVYVQVNDKDRMYLNVLIKVGINSKESTSTAPRN